MVKSGFRQSLIIAALLLSLTAVGTVGFRLLGEDSWLDSLYLAIITLTTVGSRDAGHDPASMLFLIVYLVIGLSIFSYSAFQLGQIIVNADLRRMLEGRRMQRELNDMAGHQIVCGAGRMGAAICEYLAERNQPFVLVDRNLELLQSLCHERQWRYVHGDATDDDVLKQAGIERAAALATTLSTDADNLYVVLSARLLSNGLQIVARASETSAVQKLQRAGASRVISPFNSGAVKMAKLMLSPRIEDFLEITDESGSDLALVEILIGEDSPYIDKTLAETDLRHREVIIIGIRRHDGKHIIAPGGQTRVHQGDSLFAFGKSASVQVLTEEVR
ncbi:MAG: potassium channel protein [Planctomycetaceae bacterium]|nr:potassium channel protein [Planctomycetaceae bacterium]